MTNKCIYCKSPVEDQSALDVCERCGNGVWGEKMFKTIKDNMAGARENGTLLNSEL